MIASRIAGRARRAAAGFGWVASRDGKRRRRHVAKKTREELFLAVVEKAGRLGLLGPDARRQVVVENWHPNYADWVSLWLPSGQFVEAFGPDVPDAAIDKRLAALAEAR
jgi:hypothetical protein